MDRNKRARSVIALVVALALVPGCSFAFVKGPPGPSEDPSRAPACTRSLTIPVVDAVIGGTALGLQTVIAQSDSPALVDVIVLGILGVGFAWSAYSGAKKVRACRQLEGTGGGGAYDPPPTPPGD